MQNLSRDEQYALYYENQREAKSKASARIQQENEQRKRMIAPSANDGSSPAEVASLHQKICERDAQITSLRRDVHDMGAKITSLDRDISKMNAEPTSLQHAIEEKNAKLESLLGEKDEMDNEVVALRDEISKKDIKIESLEDQVRTLSERSSIDPARTQPDKKPELPLEGVFDRSKCFHAICRLRSTTSDPAGSVVSISENKVSYVAEESREGEASQLEVQFDRVLDAKLTNKETNQYFVPLVRSLWGSKESSSILANGPSGSGKTHTLLGPQDSPMAKHECGVACSVAACLVDEAKQNPDGDRTVIPLAMEVHDTDVTDLLALDAKGLSKREKEQPPKLLRQKKRFINVPSAQHSEASWKGVQLESSDTKQQICSLVQFIHSRRTVGGTIANEVSSRSFLILLLSCARCTPAGAADSKVNVDSSLQIVDLAGSEAPGVASDNRSIGINRSLTNVGSLLRAIRHERLRQRAKGSIIYGHRASELGTEVRLCIKKDEATKAIGPRLSAGLIVLLITLNPTRKHGAKVRATLRDAQDWVKPPSSKRGSDSRTCK